MPVPAFTASTAVGTATAVGNVITPAGTVSTPAKVVGEGVVSTGANASMTHDHAVAGVHFKDTREQLRSDVKAIVGQTELYVADIDRRYVHIQPTGPSQLLIFPS